MPEHAPRRLPTIEYAGEGLAEDDLAPTPYRQVRAWVDEALARQEQRGDVPEPLALSVATVDAQGRPNVRTVLMRFLDERGPGFVTNLTSIKGRELGATGGVIAASLTWPSMFRAVRFRGRAVELTREEVAGYFDQRPYGSRLSAWASDQSAPIPDRAALEARLQAVLERFGPEPTDDGADAHGTVPVPDFWGGYRIVVDEVELWGGRRSRLHDRIVFERIGEASLDGTDAALDDAASWRRFRRQP